MLSPAAMSIPASPRFAGPARRRTCGFAVVSSPTPSAGAWSPTRPATLLGGRDRALLDQATRRFLAEPDGNCNVPLPTGVVCVPVAPNAAVNAELRVTVDGKATFVPLGGTFRDAGSVQRRYQGRLVP